MSWAILRVQERLVLSLNTWSALEIELGHSGAHAHFSISSAGRGPYMKDIVVTSQADLDGMHINPCDGSRFQRIRSGYCRVQVNFEQKASSEHSPSEQCY